MSNIEKDPGEVLDYGFDWSEWLNGDTIITSTWTVPTGITQNSETETTTTTTIWLSGGSFGQRYTIKNTITTAGGRTGVRSRIVVMKERVL